MQKVHSNLRFYLAVLTGALFLLIPAIYNGYPILNPDDNTYLCSGFIPDTPFDRPITYGLLLRLMSLNGLSLLIAVFAQCWIVSWLIFRNVRLIYWNERRYLTASVFTIFILSLLSALSWVSSELIPDIWTPMAFLCLLPILLNRESRTNTIWLYVIYVLAIATHMSNVMIFFFVLVTALLMRKWLFPLEIRKTATKRMLLAAVLALATILTMGSAISKSKHVFFVGAMLEQGILKDYLEEHCPVEQFKICAFKDSLPKDANAFLWSPESPVNRTGGWHENKEEYSKIMYGSLTQPKYIWQHIRMSIVFTMRQATVFNIGDGNFPFTRETPLNGTIKKYLPGDYKIFENARQQKGILLNQVALINQVFEVVVGISSLILLFLFLSKGKTDFVYNTFVILMLIMILFNIWDCATFAQINGRYGCRVVWLLPFVAIIGILNRFRWRGADVSVAKDRRS